MATEKKRSSYGTVSLYGLKRIKENKMASNKIMDKLIQIEKKIDNIEEYSRISLLNGIISELEKANDVLENKVSKKDQSEKIVKKSEVEEKVNDLSIFDMNKLKKWAMDNDVYIYQCEERNSRHLIFLFFRDYYEEDFTLKVKMIRKCYSDFVNTFEHVPVFVVPNLMWNQRKCLMEERISFCELNKEEYIVY